MTDQRRRDQGSVAGSGWLFGGACAIGGLLALVAAPQLFAHSLQVAPAIPSGGLTQALELHLDAPSDAYVAIGRERGLADETAVELDLALDLSRLSLLAQGEARRGTLNFLRLARQADRSAQVFVFLTYQPEKGWVLGAWSWNNTNARYTLAGEAQVAADTDALTRPLLPLTFAWTAAATPEERGTLRVWRRDDRGERDLLFEATDLDNASQTVNYVQLGVSAADRPTGLTGVLSFDDFAVFRLADSFRRAK